jgi:hypothetical protein
MRVTYLNWVGHKGFYTLEVIGVYTVISTPAKALKIAILTLSLSSSRPHYQAGASLKIASLIATEALAWHRQN